ncbi:hypothetical protein [Lentzea albidocapillata]|uniref:hypothetical protein n=1 Tax=Lentzea albidocapillata TaxID=40571 RepID=UPI000A00C6FC|nr:hypothetical protein [Lentzea albidocapillata]
MIGDRKNDHVRLAAEHHRPSGRNGFDDVTFVRLALAGIARVDVSLAVELLSVRPQNYHCRRQRQV